MIVGDGHVFVTKGAGTDYIEVYRTNGHSQADVDVRRGANRLVEIEYANGFLYQSAMTG